MTDPPDLPADPEYGPGGYLPPRAAARARKIVLREQMGLRWTIAAVVAGILILLVTVPFVLSSQGPPGPPFVQAGPLAAVDPAGDAIVPVGDAQVLVVRGGGVLRAFLDPPAGARWCPASRRIEAADGAVWTAEGRLLAGSGQSLRQAGIQAVDGLLYIDVTADTPPPPPLPGDQRASCA